MSVAQLIVGAFVASALAFIALQSPAEAKLRPQGDADRDGLSNWVEVNRTRTNPRRADTDRDGLSDRVEVRRTKTNPRKADSDDDGISDGVEVLTGSNPWEPATRPSLQQPFAADPAPTHPGPGPNPTIEAPDDEEEEGPPPAANAIWSAPPEAQVGVPVVLDGTASTGTGCEWWFENSSGSTVFQKQNGCAIEFTFGSTGTKYVRLVVQGAGGDSDSSRQSFAVTDEDTEPPPPPPPPPPPSGCVAGATTATTAAQVRSAVQADDDVCVTANVGNVNLNDLGASPVTISADGGTMGFIDIEDTTDLTIQSARFRSVEMREAHRTKLLGNVIGGSGPTDRESDQLIFMPSESNDVSIEGNDLGWTEADDSGNTGYGCRCYGATNNLRFVGNRLHDIAADGFQGSNGANVLIDRNEIGPVGATPGSSSHSDNIQIVSNGPNLRITNNWIHHQGYYEGSAVGNAGSTYIHGGTSNSVLYENNLIQIARGRTEICGLGTGGTSRSNITVRSNTWVDGGQTFNNFPSFAWECDSGAGNTVERNVAIDPDGGFALTGSAGSATFSANIWGKPTAVTLDASGNCTSANCNPAGQGPIGYRKPSGVRW